MKPLLCVPWFPSSHLRPALSSLPSPRINVLCSAELTTQYAAHKALWTARAWATIINPASQLLRVCSITTTRLSPRPCFAKGLLSIDTTTSKPQPAPWRSFSLKHAPAFLRAVRVSVLPQTWPIFKSQAEVCVSCFSTFMFFQVIAAPVSHLQLAAQPLPDSLFGRILYFLQFFLSTLVDLFLNIVLKCTVQLKSGFDCHWN